MSQEGPWVPADAGAPNVGTSQEHNIDASGPSPEYGYGDFSFDRISDQRSPLASNFSYTPMYTNNSFAPESPQQFDSSYGIFKQPESVRHTPSSLGWPPGTKLVNVYKFVVPKGKPPYFDLLEKFAPTYETPARVYLDEPK
jgi:hypothetical protein